MAVREVYWAIFPRMDHYELHINGEFYCSADTYEEAYKEYLEYERNTV